MPVLGIDTSAALSVAVIDDATEPLAALEIPDDRQHAELLAPAIEQVLAKAGVDKTKLRGIAVGTGPGPFTGLRVGIVTARALGFALGIPVWGVSSHDALAAQAANRYQRQRWQENYQGGPPPTWNFLVLTDARRKEVYWTLYQVAAKLVDTRRVGGPGVAKPAALPDVLPVFDPDEVVLIGAGAQKYAAELAVAGFDDAARLLANPPPPDLLNPSAITIAISGRIRAMIGLNQPTTPLYLRRPDVHIPNSQSLATPPPDSHKAPDDAA